MVEVNSSLKNNKQNISKILNPELKAILAKTAHTIRGLSIDAVQKADSGHPGLPMGCAEIGAYLWGYLLRYNPKNPKWPNRDRFILSAGHGSMLLYSALHLAGYPLSLEDLKNFRQLHSKTPGHPESLDTEGVETTTGPLGQGIGNAVGQALGLKLLGAKFNTETHQILNSKVYCLCGDGDLMEGVSAEASCLAAHLQLDNLILIYDSNHICLDGPTSECFTENTRMRYEAYGWEVFEMDGNNLDDIHQVFLKAGERQTRPRLIIAHTIIGKGSPNKEGTNKAHGAPLGVEEVKAAKDLLGIPQEPLFYIPSEVKEFFSKKIAEHMAIEKEWQATFNAWAQANPKLSEAYEAMSHNSLPADLEERLKAIEIKSPIAGRKASQEVLNALAPFLPQLYGGSADLSGSDLTMLKNYPLVKPGDFSGRNIKYGVREFGMATIANGLYQTHMILPFIGTFLTFSDYMRNAIRLAALQKAHVIYQFTHDSIFLGEDGPTHQPVEHYASLRAIPYLRVIRPADAHEVKMAWAAALRYHGPTAIILTRQNLPEITATESFSYADGMGRGAYLLKKENSKPDYTLLATGSEVHLALDVAAALEKSGKSVRVISMPCWELYEEQDSAYKESLLGGDLGIRVSIEAGVEQGWHKYIGLSGIAISMQSFGASAPAAALAQEFGFTVDSILKKLLP
ncbi:transketolase [Neochlamydia sp. S13]|uniref:transketolase n=1 Tax=Neochlamydia sp. S13 TaxID=1353976 RepID=UPI0005A7B80A|nr:transketolase [Neochlamydia sp. S13]BBI17699.1 transketolase [Neochlamydia sp. S13]